MTTRTYLFLLVFFALATPARAHDLSGEVRIKGDKVVLSAYFDDDTIAVAARVKVMSGKNAIAEGKTDDKGVFTFSRPQPGKYTIVVDAGKGHRTEIALEVPAQPSQPPITNTPPREDFTRYPWLKVGIGVGGIAVIALVFLFARGKSPSIT